MISEETIKHIGNLAHLELSPEEVKLYAQQLGAILDFVSQLDAVNTDGVKPMVTATDMEPTFRDDVVVQRWNVEEALANAPDKSGNLFKVPPVI